MRNLARTLLLILISSTALWAQKHPTEPEAFLKSLSKTMTTADRGRSKELLDVFEKAFLEQYSAQEQRVIMDNVNKFDDMRFRIIPDLFDYIRLLNVVVVQKTPRNQLETFHNHIIKLQENGVKKKVITDYVSLMADFFTDKTLFSTQSESVKWQGFGDYTIEFEEEPVINYKNLRLVCNSKGDSLRILETSGKCYITSNRFEGKGGTVTWEQSKFKANQVFAKLKTYEINLKRPEYVAENVTFTNLSYFQNTLQGKLEDKIIALASEERRSYPRFTSYDARIPIKNIVDKVDYEGGFAQHGLKFLGAGMPGEPAKIIIRRDNKPFMIAYSSRYLIRLKGEEVEEESEKKTRKKREETRTAKNRIVASEARVLFILNEDSIVHPGIKFTLFTDDREVNLIRSEDDMSAAPYQNSFHQVEMEFELLNWKIDEPLMTFTHLPKTAERKASFTSNLFFKQFLFDRMMGVTSRNPLSFIKKCTDKYGMTLTLNDCVECLSLPPTQLEPMLLQYQILGYVVYDLDKKLVEVQDKLVHQVLSRSRKSDYDVIAINSDVSGNQMPNAKLNLLNFDLTIDGISRITLSDSHKVQIYPKEGRIVMKKDRDFIFSGMISAGKAEFFGKEFTFKYGDFKIDMPIIDSLQLWVDTDQKAKDGVALEARVRTVIEDLRGDLKIDSPNNKSGIKRLHKYPIFTSEKESYAYYDASNVLGGVYNRNKFYFQLDPFVFDSLDNFDNSAIRFEGTFSSAGIFKDMRDVLVLQEDYSLGFTRDFPPGGEPAYGGKGTFNNQINLSNRGLRGNGSINYIHATAVSDNFYFFPDSVNGISRQFEIEGQLGAVEYPEVTTDTAFVHWRPYKDYMDVSSIKNRKPLSMYNGISVHTGTLRYSPTGLVGWGKNSFDGANLYSNMMEFKFTQLLADTSSFELESDLFGDIAFNSSDLKAKVDFQTKRAEFISNTGRSLTEFGATKYQAYLDRFTWLMESDDIEYSAEGQVVKSGTDEVQVEGAEFVSTHPKQDSLRFFAKAAIYNVKDVRITAKKVDEIQVADASIHPGDGIVVVNKDAVMNTLDSARIVANRRTKYHEMYNASVNIYGRFNYIGEAMYDFIDENQKTQTIKLHTIQLDSSKQTTAKGGITIDSEFTLNPMFNFQGDALIHANEKNLIFDGFAQINHGCTELPKTWFKFKSQIDPKDVNIEIAEKVKDQGGNELYSGVVLPLDTGKMYSAFLSAPNSRSDIEVSPAFGYLVFDKASKEFRISSFEKLNERSLPGNYVSLNTETCMLEGEGKLNLSHRMPHINVQPVGNYTFNTIEKSFYSDIMLSVGFLLDDNLWSIMVKDIKTGEGAKGVNTERPIYATGLRDLIGKKEADELLGRMSLGRSVRVPDGLRGKDFTTLFFSELPITYLPENDSYIAKGDNIGVGNIGKEMLNLYVKGGFEFVNKRQGTDMFIYMDLDKHWYAFKYRASSGIMQVYSSNEEFNAALNKVKTDKRRIKATKTNKQYLYQLGNKRLRNEALNKFEGVPE